MKLNIFVAAAAMTLAGCVTGTRAVDLAPTSFDNDITAEGEIYIVEISDNRTFEQKPSDPSTPSVKGELAEIDKATLSTLIGRQRNGYGAAMGDVALPEGSTVPEEMRDLLVEGLQSRGYTVSDNAEAPIQLAVDVDKFWGWMTPGFVTIKFEANVGGTLSFTGDIEQEFVVTARSINNAQVASDANWQLAFSRAFDEFLKELDIQLDAEGL